MAAGYTNSVSQIQLTVRGGTAQPVGVEGMIWSKTANAVTSWVVSPQQPGEAAEGMVWILDGKNNSINILRKNAVEVFPSGCRQYIGGTWEPLDAFLFRSGTWIAFSAQKTYLYDAFASDTQCTDITGGWAAKAWKTGSYAGGAGAPALNVQGDMLASIAASSVGGAVHTNRKILFGEHKTLCVSVVQASVGSNIWGSISVLVGKSLTAQYSIEGNSIASIGVIDGEGKRNNFSIDDFTVSIPVDGISGEYPVIISLYSTVSTRIRQIWFDD